MTRAVTAGYDNLPEAEGALDHVAARVPLLDGAVIANTPAGRLRLQNLPLSPQLRETCEGILERAGFLFVALVMSQAAADDAIQVLNAMPTHDIAPAPAPEPASARVPAGQAEEQRIPLIEESLSVDKREVAGTTVRVQTHVREAPVREQVELVEEQLMFERRPANRRLSPEEVAAGRLFEHRVFDFGEMGEEAVVSKQAVVREELVVRKTADQRTEHIHDSVRRTEAEIEQLSADSRPAFPGLARDGRQPAPTAKE